MDESSNSPSSAMIIGNCLSCQGLVRVPSKAPSTSQVRCPHCSESYALWEILDQAVPELELVDEHEHEEEEEIPRVDQVVIKKEGGTERETFVVPPQLSKGARRPRRRRRSDSSDSSNGSGDLNVPSFEGISPRASASAGDASPSRSSQRSSSSHSSRRSSSKRGPRHPKPSQVTEILKVAIGGALAIPIAYLLLFWVFNQDPLDVGPSLGKVIPFVVPENLRGPVEEEAVKPVKRKSQPADDEGDHFDQIMDVDPDRLGNLNL